MHFLSHKTFFVRFWNIQCFTQQLLALIFFFAFLAHCHISWHVTATSCQSADCTGHPCEILTKKGDQTWKHCSKTPQGTFKKLTVNHNNKIIDRLTGNENIVNSSPLIAAILPNISQRKTAIQAALVSRFAFISLQQHEINLLAETWNLANPYSGHVSIYCAFLS